jgi:hypothetical protein
MVLARATYLVLERLDGLVILIEGIDIIEPSIVGLATSEPHHVRCVGIYERDEAVHVRTTREASARYMDM